MINPIVVILLVAFLLCFFVFCVLNKPKKPIMTGAVLVAITIFLFLTNCIDNAIASASTMSDFEKNLVAFITLSSTGKSIELENSFKIFASIDIALFVVAILSMVIELRSILSSFYSKHKTPSPEDIQ